MDSAVTNFPIVIMPELSTLTLSGIVRATVGNIPVSSRLASQACSRPVTQDGLPLIGAVPGVRGAYVGTGHGVWGILNAPATGEAMAELILDGASRAVDLSPFDPARLTAVDCGRAAVTRRLGR